MTKRNLTVIQCDQCGKHIEEENKFKYNISIGPNTLSLKGSLSSPYAFADGDLCDKCINKYKRMIGKEFFREMLTKAELEICRQWFTSVLDTNPAFLNKTDFAAAKQIYLYLGIDLTKEIKENT